MTPSDRRWMLAAFAIARRGSGKTSTNPAVGCVIVKDGRLLGRGHTGEGGRPHAETEALQMALVRFGARAVTGATAYVTLEPCAHHGRTPPCADALVAAGIARVVAPLADPDPRVSGAGFAKLRAGGVEVVTGVAAPEGEAQLAGYLRRVRTGRPHVTLKLAATLDGRIAMASGESRWITGPAARRRVHLMRAAVDGVLVGGGTALADDPMLDVRLPGLERRNPVRIVADRRLRMPASARMLADATRAPVWVIGDGEGFPERASALTAAGARLVQCAADGDIAMQLATLGRLGLGTVLCEGGGGLAAALLKAGCVDRLHMISAGRMIGAEGTGCLGPLGIENLAETPRFARIGIEALGADIMTTWEPATGTA